MLKTISDNSYALLQSVLYISSLIVESLYLLTIWAHDLQTIVKFNTKSNWSKYGVAQLFSGKSRYRVHREWIHYSMGTFFNSYKTSIYHIYSWLEWMPQLNTRFMHGIY